MNILLGLSLVIAFSYAAAAEKPFSHRLHIEEEELDCSDCHAATGSEQASDDLNPSEATCRECHDPGKVRTQWPAVARELLFSHKRHITFGLECLDCHAGVPAMDKPGPGALPQMETCMDCHSGLMAPRDCESCHTQDRASLRPSSHLPDWKETHGQQARITDNTCRPCHAVSECQECHEGALLHESSALSNPRQTSFAPALEGSGMVIARVHNLNYRFWHGLEARGKQTSCNTCHEVDAGDFCADCHNAAQNTALKPTWHGGSDWGARVGGVGTGGGRHAELARRDIENCVSCHDQAGEDPTCLLCHTDWTRGLGNNPRTHSKSFAGDFGAGDFHDDDDASCYTCHLYRGPVGEDGFCGYCHGPLP